MTRATWIFLTVLQTASVGVLPWATRGPNVAAIVVALVGLTTALLARRGCARGPEACP